ncbi:MAG: YpdA family putative bacillithiol disulfide reductase [Candidatus Kapaibacterium sp.]|nr:MAG: YpdA family putative bacillithiol disulfide reductase [Candidatus Kapabacteria bacterium]
MTNSSPYDILIIGAGPTGLACAIEAQKAHCSYLVLEKGSITETIRRYPANMTFFSTPDLLSLDNIPFSSVNVRPTRREALQYYRGVAEAQKLNLRLHTRVCGIRKEVQGNSSGNISGNVSGNSNEYIFCIETRRETSSNISSDAPLEKIFARRVIIATGYFDFTNRLGILGEDLPHVSHYYDEPYRYTMQDVVVVGGRNSAVEAALELWRHGARVTLVHRGEELSTSVKYWVRPDIDNRIKNGEIRALFSTQLTEIRTNTALAKNSATGETTTLPADFIFPLIGYRPDEHLLRGAGVHLNEILIPEYNAETFETNVQGLYIAGSVACGCQTWTIFIENGRNHARPVVADILRSLGR